MNITTGTFITLINAVATGDLLTNTDYKFKPTQITRMIRYCKNIGFVAVVLFSISGCHTPINKVETSTKKINMSNMKIPELSKESEKFSIENFRKKLEKKRDLLGLEFSGYKNETVTPEQLTSLNIDEKNKLTPQEFQSYSEAFRVYILRSQKEKYHITERRYLKNLDYHTSEIFNNSYLTIYKEFRSSGDLRRKYLLYNSNIIVGVGYHYGSDGELVGEVDYEEGYEYTFFDVVDYLMKKSIEFPLGYQSSRGGFPAMARVEQDGKKLWRIKYREFTDRWYNVVETIDGKSGKVIDSEREAFTI